MAVVPSSQTQAILWKMKENFYGPSSSHWPQISSQVLCPHLGGKLLP